MKYLFTLVLIFTSSIVFAQNYKVIGMGSKSNYFVFDAKLIINDSFLTTYHTLDGKITETKYTIKLRSADTIVVTEKDKEFKVIIKAKNGKFDEYTYSYLIEWYYMEQLGLTYLCNLVTNPKTD